MNGNSFFNGAGNRTPRDNFSNFKNSKVRSEVRMMQNDNNFFNNNRRSRDQDRSQNTFFNSNQQNNQTRQPGSFFNNNKENYANQRNNNFSNRTFHSNNDQNGTSNRNFLQNDNLNRTNFFSNSNNNQQNNIQSRFANSGRGNFFGTNNNQDDFNNQPNFAQRNAQNNGQFFRRSKNNQFSSFGTDNNWNNNNRFNNNNNQQQQTPGFFNNNRNNTSNTGFFNNNKNNNDNQNSFFQGQNQNNNNQFSNNNQQNNFNNNNNNQQNNSNRSFFNNNQPNNTFFNQNNNQQNKTSGFFGNQQNTNSFWNSTTSGTNTFFNNQNNNTGNTFFNTNSNNLQWQNNNPNQNNGFFNSQLPIQGQQQNLFSNMPMNYPIQGQILYAIPNQLQPQQINQYYVDTSQKKILQKNQDEDIDTIDFNKQQIINDYNDIFETQKFYSELAQRELEKVMQERRKEVEEMLQYGRKIHKKKKNTIQIQPSDLIYTKKLNNQTKLNSINELQKQFQNQKPQLNINRKQNELISINNQDLRIGDNSSEFRFEQKREKSELLKLFINFKCKNITLDVDCFNVYSDITIADLKQKIFEYLLYFQREIKYQDLEFDFRDIQFENENVVLKNVYNIENVVLKVIFPYDLQVSQKPQSQELSQLYQKNNNEQNIGQEKQNFMNDTENKKFDQTALFSQDLELAPQSLLPIVSNNYQIQPNIVELSRMTLKQLQNVDNFLIKNQFGQIQFEEPIDLTSVNIDQDVRIKKGSVSVYPEDIYGSDLLEKPNFGEKLNKKCKISLFNFNAKNQRALINTCQKQGLEFIEYNPNAKIFTFRSLEFKQFNQIYINSQYKQQINNEKSF